MGVKISRIEAFLPESTLSNETLAKEFGRWEPDKIESKLGTSFVFLSSVMGKQGESGKIVYCASKGAILSGVKAMAIELAPKKIRCNCILPGIVETDRVNILFKSIPLESKEKIVGMHPLGLGKPDDIAALVSFVLSDQARWITGSDLVIDGGYSAK